MILCRKQCVGIASSNENDKFVKPVSINGFLLEAFVDLGSEVTLVKESVAKSLDVSHDERPTTMMGFGNHLVQPLRSVNLDLAIDSQCLG